MPQGRTSIIALSAGLTLLAPPALASDLFPPPAPDSAQTTPVPSADIIWQRTIETYRAAVFGERVRISITRPRSPRPGPAGADADRLALEELLTAPGDEQRGVVFLRAAMVPPPPTTSPTTSPEQPTPNEAPAGEPSPARTPMFRLEMGDVRVYGEFGRLLAVRASVPGGVVIRTFDGPVTQPALDRLIPRMLLPTLSMLLAAPATTCDLTPGLSAPAWSSSTRIRESGKNRLVLRGATRSDRGEHNLTATIDEATSRLVSMRIEPPLGDADTQPLIELFFAPIDPGDPATWIIDPAGRIEVPSLERLRAAPPTTPITPTTPATPATPGPTPQGPTPRTTDPIIPPPDRIASAATLPALHLLNARTEAWASERTPAGRFAGLIPDDAAHFRVVLLFNLPSHTADRAGRETLTRTAAAINTAIARARNVSPDPSVTLSAASVAVLELEGFDDARRRAQDAWQQLDPTAAAPALPLLCSPAGRAMYARFSARLVPVIVVVDERLAIREMIEIEPGAGVPADLVERLASMLSTGP